MRFLNCERIGIRSSMALMDLSQSLHKWHLQSLQVDVVGVGIFGKDLIENLRDSKLLLFVAGLEGLLGGWRRHY